MSRKKRGFLQGFGAANQILKTIIDAVLEKGGDDEDLRRILSDADLPGKIAKLIVKTRRQVFKIVADYTQTLSQMIQAGKYDWVNSNITQDNFPINGSGKKEEEIVLFHFNKVMASVQVIAEMDEAGFRPAAIEELLSLGVSQPELQKNFPVVALGSVWQLSSGSRGVPCLDWSSARRRLSLRWLGDDWLEDYRFASVRK